MTVAHLRGIDRPAALVLESGCYSNVSLIAFDGINGDILWRQLQKRGAGHNLDVADIDWINTADLKPSADDGVQEVIAGGICYDGDGTIKWEAELFGHTDISKPANIDPNRPGDAGPEVVFIIRKEVERIVRLKKVDATERGEIEDLPDGRLPQGGIYGRNLACADVIGDFRENIVTLDEERERLMVLVNPTVASVRGYPPYDDFGYRHDRSQHGSGYYIYLSPPDTAVNR